MDNICRAALTNSYGMSIRFCMSISHRIILIHWKIQWRMLRSQMPKVTWVFNDGFVPSAKITSEGSYSIISDYLGTPVEAYDF